MQNHILFPAVFYQGKRIQEQLKICKFPQCSPFSIDRGISEFHDLDALSAQFIYILPISSFIPSYSGFPFFCNRTEIKYLHNRN